MHLFGETRGIPLMASPRVQQWALALSSYHYHIMYMYKPGKEHSIADLFSRLPLPETPAEVPVPTEMILLIESAQNAPWSFTQVKHRTTQDPIMSQVLKFVMQGWLASCKSSSLLPF